MSRPYVIGKKRTVGFLRRFTHVLGASRGRVGRPAAGESLIVGCRRDQQERFVGVLDMTRPLYNRDSAAEVNRNGRWTRGQAEGRNTLKISGING
ncbi:MAG: hypothetical protein LAP85_26965 [Acidobacteriia bacterium]|nr:hypothetical protein [Terriglobia bacterium]